jgi:hypothetical protein
MHSTFIDENVEPVERLPSIAWFQMTDSELYSVVQKSEYTWNGNAYKYVFLEILHLISHLVSFSYLPLHNFYKNVNTLLL